METLVSLVVDRHYPHITRHCRELEANISVTDPNPIFYSIFILGHLLQDELPSARSVYQRTPPSLQETSTLKFIHSLLQRAWNRDYTGFYAVVSQLENGLIKIEEPVGSLVIDYKRYFLKTWWLIIGSWQSRTLALLSRAYESINPEKAAEYLGLPSDQIIKTLQQEGWTYAAEKNLLYPPKSEQQRRDVRYEVEFADFARLTEIAMVLKGR